ncbi:MAG TPA: choice-of-anchor E domain-containing protein [Puia sp.]|nr:choice-of-anchor E domain-containing protein [Puia sp.]
MKQIYSSLFALVLFFSISIPLTSSAQCFCSGGSPATAVTYLDSVLPTQASSSIFSFPKFDPTIGTLSCISFNDTISAVVTTAARNTDTTDGHTYIFQTTISDAVTGPSSTGPNNWLVTFASSNQTYGPVYLDTDKIDLHPPQPRLPDDSTTFGPDTLINNTIGAGSTSTVSPFLGTTGTVDFTTSLTGGAIATFGGVNYTTALKSNSWGAFRLTYYWCPTILLAENIINFMAVKKNNYVQLQWVTENEQTGFTYEIEYSKDGSNYIPVGYEESGSDINQQYQYQYQYTLSNDEAAVIFFRVKRTGADGKSTYTVIKSVNINGENVSAGMQVYPNPVKNSVIFAFDEIQNANFSIQLVNVAGQVIQQNAVTVSGNNQIRLNLTSAPARGLYYLYAKDLTHNQQYITKVLINN